MVSLDPSDQAKGRVAPRRKDVRRVISVWGSVRPGGARVRADLNSAFQRPMPGPGSSIPAI